MQEYNYTDNYLAHYGVLGTKWGVRRARRNTNKAKISRESAKEWDEMAGYAEQRGDTKKAVRYRKNASSDRRDAAKYEAKAKEYSRKVKSSNSTELSPYQQERLRQKKHLMTKRAVDLGSRFVNEYTKRRNVTLNGRHVGVPDVAKQAINIMLDYRYMKNTFK